MGSIGSRRHRRAATAPPLLAESNRSDDDDVARLEEYHDDEFVDDGRAGPGTPGDANAREPLHAAYRYLRNRLHPARHPDVVRARRIRSAPAETLRGPAGAGRLRRGWCGKSGP